MIITCMWYSEGKCEQVIFTYCIKNKGSHAFKTETQDPNFGYNSYMKIFKVG